MPLVSSMTIGPWSYQVSERSANLRVRRREGKLGLGVAGVVAFGPLWQKAFTSTLTPARECGPSAFRSHTRTEAVLTLPGPFRWLISAFHKAEKFASRELKAVTLGW